MRDYIVCRKWNSLWFKFSKISNVVDDGISRRNSSFIWINTIGDADAKVKINDGTRPLVSQETINLCINALDNYNAVYTVISTADTIVEINNDLYVENIPIRRYMKIGQTP